MIPTQVLNSALLSSYQETSHNIAAIAPSGHKAERRDPTRFQHWTSSPRLLWSTVKWRRFIFPSNSGRWFIQSPCLVLPTVLGYLRSRKLPVSAYWKRNTAFLRFLLLRLVFLSSSVHPAGRGRAKELDLGSAFLRRGRGLGCGAGGRGRRALQGPQSLAEPRVLIGLNLGHQNSPLMLELLQSHRRIQSLMRARAGLSLCHIAVL